MGAAGQVAFTSALLSFRFAISFLSLGHFIWRFSEDFTAPNSCTWPNTHTTPNSALWHTSCQPARSSLSVKSYILITVPRSCSCVPGLDDNVESSFCDIMTHISAVYSDDKHIFILKLTKLGMTQFWHDTF